MNNTLNVIKIVLLSIIAVTLIGLLIILLNGKINIKGISLYEKTELVYENTFIEDIDSFDIYTTNNDVKIVEKDIEGIEVKIYDRKDAKPEVEVQNDKLVITNKDDINIGFSFGINGNSRIEISVPKDTIYNLNVNGTSSDVDSLINLKNVNINTTSGDTNLKDTINTVIETTSGDLKINDVSESLNVKSTSGDMTIGDVTGKLTLSTTSGDISINKLELNSDSSIKVVSGDVNIGKINDIYINAKTISGDTKIDVNNRHAEYELKINTTSGDVIVRN